MSQVSKHRLASVLECLSLGDMNDNKRLSCLWCPASLGHTLCLECRS